MNTDPIADLFTRIRNAQATGLGDLEVPYSDFKMRLVQLMADNGFLGQIDKKGSKAQKSIHLILIYKDGQPAIHEITRISKPGQRIYLENHEIRSVKRGRGMGIISTSKGLVSDQDAKKQKVGGELIGEIW